MGETECKCGLFKNESVGFDWRNPSHNEASAFRREWPEFLLFSEVGVFSYRTAINRLKFVFPAVTTQRGVQRQWGFWTPVSTARFHHVFPVFKQILERRGALIDAWRRFKGVRTFLWIQGFPRKKTIFKYLYISRGSFKIIMGWPWSLCEI